MNPFCYSDLRVPVPLRQTIPLISPSVRIALICLSLRRVGGTVSQGKPKEPGKAMLLRRLQEPNGLLDF